MCGEVVQPDAASRPLPLERLEGLLGRHWVRALLLPYPLRVLRLGEQGQGVGVFDVEERGEVHGALPFGLLLHAEQRAIATEFGVVEHARGAVRAPTEYLVELCVPDHPHHGRAAYPDALDLFPGFTAEEDELAATAGFLVAWCFARCSADDQIAFGAERHIRGRVVVREIFLPFHHRLLKLPHVPELQRAVPPPRGQSAVVAGEDYAGRLRLRLVGFVHLFLSAGADPLLFPLPYLHRTHPSCARNHIAVGREATRCHWHPLAPPPGFELDVLLTTSLCVYVPYAHGAVL
mmetsp:Transcript_17493/g.27958  ORF Transcript_17493/g.27958 Transcript_17493/m.27958 type:complete len:291 (+) Transcript_17493:349-1221(+)